MGLISRVSSRTYRDIISREVAFNVMASPCLRREVKDLYKRLLWLGRDWPEPQGFAWFQPKLKKAFASNAELTDHDSIQKCIDRGKFVEKEISTLYYLKKYRTIKNRYMGDDPSKFGPQAIVLQEYIDDTTKPTT